MARLQPPEGVTDLLLFVQLPTGRYVPIGSIELIPAVRGLALDAGKVSYVQSLVEALAEPDAR